MSQLSVHLERTQEQSSEWKIRKINGIEQPQWYNGPGYPSLDAYCTDEVKRGLWRGSSVDYGEHEAFITFWS